MHRHFRAAWALSIAVAAPLAWAQTAPAVSRPDPQDAKASVPPIDYRSPFADYRALRDEAMPPWKAANDEVGRVGGWRAYAREAEEAKPAKPNPDGHSLHRSAP